MPSRDWTGLDWTPALNFALPNERQLAQSSLADAGRGAEYKFAPTPENAALLQALGYNGQGLADVAGSDYGFGAQPVWSDEARTWLANSGYNVGVAHDPGTSPGGRPEYYGLTDPSGKWVQGQSDPTMTMSDTLMDQITPFLMMAGPFVSAISTSAGLASGAGAGLSAGTGTLGASGSGVTSLGAGMSPEALGLTGSLGSGVSAADLAALSQALPGAVEGGLSAGAGAAGTAGSSLMPGATNLWDAVQSGALRGAGSGAIKGIATGQNPLQSALKGALTGAVGGGISSVGSGALGNAMSLDSGTVGMDIIPGAFDAPADSLTDSIFNNVGSFADAAGGAGGNMGLDQYLWGMDPSGGFTSALGGYDLGSFADPGFQWDFSGLDASNLPQADYSNEGRNYSGPGGINPVYNSPAYTEDTPFIDLSASGGSSWLDTLKGWFTPIPNGTGGTKPNPMGGAISALVGAGLGAASGGGTLTKTNEPWVEAQPFLKNALGGLDDALTNLRQQPYTPQQTQQYQQAFSGLDQARSAMPALMNWGQNAMQRQSTTPSYDQLFGGLLGQQPTAQAGGAGGLLGPQDRIKALMARGQGLIG